MNICCAYALTAFRFMPTSLPNFFKTSRRLMLTVLASKSYDRSKRYTSLITLDSQRPCTSGFCVQNSAQVLSCASCPLDPRTKASGVSQSL